MTAVFWLCALALSAAAMLPLLHALRRHAGPGARLLAFALAPGLPIVAAGLYLLVGMPAAVNGLPLQPPPTEQQWLAQAQAAEARQDHDAARAAYAEALRLRPDDAVAALGWVEAGMATRADLAIDTQGFALLQRLLAREPDNQRGLWLLGIGRFQRQDYAGAAAHWRRLLDLLDHGSPLRQAVAERIATAESLAHTPETTASAKP